MTNNATRQEVEVTDIRMRFSSMVLFMVKWAISSIPALIILVVLGAALWGVAIGLFMSLAGISRQQPGSAKATSGISAPTSSSVPPEEVAYLSKVLVRNVTVARTVLGGSGVFGEVKNTGDRTLKEVEITIYCLGGDGKPVFEKTYNPVLVSEIPFGEVTEPLKPGYSRQFGVKMDDAPSDWTKKVDVKVSKVGFK
jgi:hypothetical protein